MCAMISSSVFCFGGSGRKLRKKSASEELKVAPPLRASTILCARRVCSCVLILCRPFSYLAPGLRPRIARLLPTSPGYAGRRLWLNIHPLVIPCTRLRLLYCRFNIFSTLGRQYLQNPMPQGASSTEGRWHPI